MALIAYIHDSNKPSLLVRDGKPEPGDLIRVGDLERLLRAFHSLNYTALPAYTQTGWKSALETILNELGEKL